MVLDLAVRGRRGAEITLAGRLHRAVGARLIVGREQPILAVAGVIRPQGRACVEEPTE